MYLMWCPAFALFGLPSVSMSMLIFLKKFIKGGPFGHSEMPNLIPASSNLSFSQSSFSISVSLTLEISCKLEADSSSLSTSSSSPDPSSKNSFRLTSSSKTTLSASSLFFPTYSFKSSTIPLTTALSNLGEVDPAFIQELEHRPKPKISEAGGIPVIDLSPLSNSESLDDPDVLKPLVKEIGDACREWGFFQVINHGVPSDVQRRIEVAAREFIGLSKEEKAKVRRDEINPLGYYDTEHTKNVRDWKEVFDFAVLDPTVIPASHKPEDEELQELRNQWPDYPPGLREACEEYAHNIENLSYELLELISLSLGLPAKHLNGFFKDQTSIIRLNHYPPCPVPDRALGVGRHKDGGVLTVLAQDDVGGLDVKRKLDGEWVRVKPIPNAYIINVGDTVQVWSNDKYESVEHRVMVNSEKERFSIPFFLFPADYVNVKPLDELVDEQNPAQYKELNWGKFFRARKGSNFKKLDVENIRIHHFKISL